MGGGGATDELDASVSTATEPTALMRRQTHLLVDGGVTGGGGHPHLLVEVVADGIRHVDGRVRVAAQDGPDRK